MLSQKKLPVSNREPIFTEGKDNEMRIVTLSNGVYIFYKHNGEWYKTKMEKV